MLTALLLTLTVRNYVESNECLAPANGGRLTEVLVPNMGKLTGGPAPKHREGLREVSYVDCSAVDSHKLE